MKVAIVGAGLSGATVATILSPFHKVTVFEKLPHVAGMAYTEKDPETGILVHKYGPHIFHTKKKDVLRFVQQFGEWVPFDLRTKTYIDGRVYSGPPINLATHNEYWVVHATPGEAERRMRIFTAPYQKDVYANFEEAALAKVGVQMYETFLKGYTEKQWGLPCTDIPASVLARLNINYSYDDSRFCGEWQALPRHGYTEVVKGMLSGIDVKLGTAFEPDQASEFDHVFWTAPLDELYGCVCGPLAYRTLDFQEVRLCGERDVQGTPIMCYPGNEQFTRVTEHKHFAPWEKPTNNSVVSIEFPRQCGVGDLPFYPIETVSSNKALETYRALARKEQKITTLGRLGTYRYLNMDQAIDEAMKCAHRFLLLS